MRVEAYSAFRWVRTTSLDLKFIIPQVRTNNPYLKSKNSVMNAFNGSIRSLRRLLRSSTYALDSTIIVTKPNFPGCGKTKRKKESHHNDLPEYEYIHGFKLFVLYEVKSRIIAAMNIVPANESDHNYFLPMIKQGIHNCGKEKIKLVIADRGFLNGNHLWELKYKLGINFIIPAKAGMTIRDDAIALRKAYEKQTKAELEETSNLLNLPQNIVDRIKNEQ